MTGSPILLSEAMARLKRTCVAEHLPFFKNLVGTLGIYLKNSIPFNKKKSLFIILK